MLPLSSAPLLQAFHYSASPYSYSQLSHGDLATSECFYNTECKRGLTIRFWIYLYGTPDTLPGPVYVVDSGALDTDSWGYTFFYANQSMHYVISTSVAEWRAHTAIGLQQWTHVAVAWYPHVGLSVHINGEYQGFWSSKTRRDDTTARVTDGVRDTFIGTTAVPWLTRSPITEPLPTTDR